MSDEQSALVRRNKKLLLEHRVPLSKIRFVFRPIFTYDTDKNIIDPIYKVYLPLYSTTKLFAIDAPEISVNKPENLVIVPVESYHTDDNYQLLKQILKNIKIGIVIMICDETFIDSDGKSQDYKFSVDNEVIRFAILDNYINSEQKCQQE